MPWEVTEKYIRSGHGTGNYETCRTTDFGGRLPKGMKAIYCKVKGQDKWEVQSFLFPKDQWTEQEARKWFNEHKSEFKMEIEGKELDLKQVEYLDTIYNILREQGKEQETAHKIAVKQFKSLYRQTESGWEVDNSHDIEEKLELVFDPSESDFEKIDLGIYKKEILRTGNYAHPQYPEKRFVVTKDRIKSWIENFKKKLLDIVQVPKTNEYGHDAVERPENNTGEVVDVWDEKNEDGSYSLWGKLKVDKATSKLIDEKKLVGVSASIRKFRDNKSGKVIGEILHHVLLTNDPYMTGTSPFIPVVNNNNEIVESVVSLSRVDNQDKFTCQCVDCGHTIQTQEHCTNLKCSECGGQMRRAERPGSGKPEEHQNEFTAVPYKAYKPEEAEAWDATAAVNRIRKWASSDGSGEKDTIDWNKYKEGFAWYDGNDKENFGSYKLPHHDVSGGNLITNRAGVIAAGAALAGARGGVDIPSGDRSAVESHINKHRNQFDLEPLSFSLSESEIEQVNKELEENNLGGKEDMEKIKELEAKLEAERKEKEKQEKRMADLEKRNKELEAEREEQERKEDEAFVEGLLEAGKITEAMKDKVLIMLGKGRTESVELEGNNEVHNVRDLFVEFMNELPKAIDYGVKGKEQKGKPEEEDASLESDGVKAGKKVKGVVEDK